VAATKTASTGSATAPAKPMATLNGGGAVGNTAAAGGGLNCVNNNAVNGNGENLVFLFVS